MHPRDLSLGLLKAQAHSVREISPAYHLSILRFREKRGMKTDAYAKFINSYWRQRYIEIYRKENS